MPLPRSVVLAGVVEAPLTFSLLGIFFTVADFSLENFLLFVVSEFCCKTGGYSGLATAAFAIRKSENGHFLQSVLIIFIDIVPGAANNHSSEYA